MSINLASMLLKGLQATLLRTWLIWYQDVKISDHVLHLVYAYKETELTEFSSDRTCLGPALLLYVVQWVQPYRLGELLDTMK